MTSTDPQTSQKLSAWSDLLAVYGGNVTRARAAWNANSHLVREFGDAPGAALEAAQTETQNTVPHGVLEMQEHRVDDELERTIQRRIKLALERHGYIVWEMYLGSRRGGQVWMTKGIPDLRVLGWGWIEVKRPGQEPSREQQDRHAEARLAGERVVVVTTVQAALFHVLESV